MLTVVAAVIGIAVGALGLWAWLRTASTSRLRLAEDQRRSILADADREAETTRREAQIEAREQAVALRAEIESEIQESRLQMAKIEERVHQRETELDAKREELSASGAGRRRPGDPHEAAPGGAQGGERRDAARARARRRAHARRGPQAAPRAIGGPVRHELARTVRQLEEEARTDAKRRARALVADALQRVAASHTAETTVSVVELASDDMKGRIIGREGRNIRSLEHLTGVDFIIDDTPHAVVLSSFDGLRREIARLTLEKLIEDGRIHPARIEEMYYLSKAELEDHVRLAGEQAVFEANCGEFHEELVKILGRLRYRTSYGQNVLKHTLEVVHLAGIMAAELGASVRRRAARRSSTTSARR